MAHDGWKDRWKTDEQDQGWLRSRQDWDCEAGFHCEDCLSVLDALAAKSASSAAKVLEAAVGQLSEHGAGWADAWMTAAASGGIPMSTAVSI